MSASRLCRLAALGLLATTASAPAGAQTSIAAISADDLAAQLARTAPKADRRVLQLAAHAMRCALQRPELGVSSERLSVIDYSRPSTEPRMWVFDLARQRLLFEEWVAHGRNSGENRTEHFSNRDGSFMSSIGAFTAQETYMGGNGYSLRLAGLEPGFNDRARERAIVIHGAPYVNPSTAQLQGRLGRSLGCPAVRLSVAKPLIDALRGGTMVFAYYPDKDWLKHSQLLGGDCGTAAGLATR
ncbi:murein L,D-transpeptidase catalytic domain family protein [Stenotrophomonas indicatrix]|uniref:murein L,D-transpeptidase catalytic domain family protein n=1 Tax=Stenotrophomonas indicatrix TaxID=2045451 RepID=UPI001AA16FBE|nr:murein L,D-transpeptidase catalytic domain family protein [Stenotrophomonas indicatrix]MBO1748501.1 murein L,D-transpeptidase catalytic domain family protein [Stenotrophomonas indicatrix]MDN8647283.1 murein L,D-transpeptidase catalytic domain family protein [Stenotrophomonas indicatrix]